jgi:hypothetical protein
MWKPVRVRRPSPLILKHQRTNQSHELVNVRAGAAKEYPSDTPLKLSNTNGEWK